ncbi:MULTISPECIES: DNA ligase D [Chryseobacterium]|uniref:DNA ligase (ATP) n=1 Tax=Chryseobacterium geocarposphaerae TaxID=1416776 RepID=A0ABU1LB55_9FLAO|nr:MULTISPECIES: DNA ligase D [Chryseobacterium]MDR6403956.1 bifunctional non-homologous end joining protein LigD [Chryseobacterium geocarposphaerae]MDR6698525.1 bifunctional non-homologous end joining protein LigD [Chryseobacterium ginsenosidimutans]
MAAKTTKKNEPQKKLQTEIGKEAVAHDKTSQSEISLLLKKAKKATWPADISPMLATLVDEPFSDPDWVYEVKWDGYRTIAYIDNGKVDLRSRNNKIFTDKYYSITEIFKSWNIKAVIDGEITVINKNGVSDFASLQNWRSETDGELIFYAFDLLWYDGKDLTQLPLLERHAILNHIFSQNNDDRIRISTIFNTDGIEFFEAAQKLGLEGIMAKKANGTYDIGARSKDWLKIKTDKRQEVVIGGFTNNEGSSKIFSSLLLGVYQGKEFHYVGKVGTGFSSKKQKEMMEEFKPLITKKNPFNTEPDINKPSRFRPNPPKATATWLKPELVCEVSYAEITDDGVFRHPSFKGMRSDKKAKEVHLEVEKNTENIIADTGNTQSEEKKDHIVKASENKSVKTLLNPTEKTQVKKVKGHELKFTNLDKIFWPDEKLRKRDLINYYFQVAPYILPYLKDRPQSMNRFPNGIHGKSFYFKDVTGKAPDWVKTFLYHSETDDRDRHYLVGDDEATLLYMANLGCIEMNPWSSTIQKPDHPSFCIIDLDPDKNSFDQVIEAAQVTKQILDDLGIPSYCKTSGSTGLHIYIPLGNKYTYEQSKEFARVIVTLVHNELSEFTSIERAIKDRKGKMYLDFLQNRPHATIAAAYSVRPKPGVTVSMPLHWDEVKKGLKMSDFTILNAVERLESEGDIFKPVLGKGIDLVNVIKKFSEGF